MIKRYAFQDAGGVAGTPTIFVATTNQTGDATFAQETENITGAAGATVNLQLTTVTNTNTMGQIFFNGALCFINNTWTITLDGTGKGSFVVKLSGDASQTGTIVRGIWTITGVSAGSAIGSPSSKQVSKVF